MLEAEIFSAWFRDLSLANACFFVVRNSLDMHSTIVIVANFCAWGETIVKGGLRFTEEGEMKSQLSF